MIAITDKSFLIDWVKYTGWDLIFKLFELIYIPESVFNEVRSETTLLWIAEGLENNKMAIFPEISELRNEALRLVLETRRLPIRPVDFPEAYCVVVGKVQNYIVLTENGGALALVNYYDEYKEVKVMRALEALIELYKRGFIQEIKGEVKDYSRGRTFIEVS